MSEQIILINFRKEILPFLPKAGLSSSPTVDDTLDDCSDVLGVSDTMAIAAHNEDANVALVGHTYGIKVYSTFQILFNEMTKRIIYFLFLSLSLFGKLFLFLADI